MGGTVGYLIGGYVVHHRASGVAPSAFFITPLIDARTRTYGLHVEFAPEEVSLKKFGNFIGRLEGAKQNLDAIQKALGSKPVHN